jgi:isoleucyl-tRNA synthetase
MRKEAGFQLDDRIVTYYDAGEHLNAVVAEWADYVRAETLSLELVPGPLPADIDHQGSFKLEGHLLTLGVKKS